MQDVGVWSIIPPIIAIVLAVITKEVIFSLICGILSGTVIYVLHNQLCLIECFPTAIGIMTEKLGENAAMIVFLSLLGGLVAVITKAGGSSAYASWAQGHFKSPRTALTATAIFSACLFLDDYFNCITSGTVMRPVTDRFRISREKLSYIVDMMAASMAILAPVSSWAASVMSYIPAEGGAGGMQAFLRAAPLNFYAVGTIFMVFWICIRKKGDYGPMAEAEAQARRYGVQDTEQTENEISRMQTSSKGRVWDLAIPITALLVFSVLAMLYVGGFWSEDLSLIEAFGKTDAPAALALGGAGALLVAFFLFIPPRIMPMAEFFKAFNDGVKSMVGASVILTLAWSISSVCRSYLGTGEYVARIVRDSGIPVPLLPAIAMVVAGLLAFATGTSWGTFGILIPIVVTICDTLAPEMTVLSLSAVLAGSVFGDQISPISDVVILSSTSSGCELMRHVITQIPYALTVAGCAVAAYLAAGFSVGLGYSVYLPLSLGVFFLLLIAALFILPRLFPGRREEIVSE